MSKNLTKKISKLDALETQSTSSTGGHVPVHVNRFSTKKMCSLLTDVIFASQEINKILYSEINKILSPEINKILSQNDESIIDDSYAILKKSKEIFRTSDFYIEQNQCVFRCFYETECAPAQDDPRWLVMRQKGIGASEAEKPMMANHLSTKIKWVKEKAGLLPAFSGNEATELGHQMEPVVGKILECIFETTLLESTSLEHPEHPILRASLDRYGWLKGMPYIIEIKSPSARIPKPGYIKSEYDKQMYQQHEVSGIENGMFADMQYVLFDTYSELMNSFKAEEDLTTKYYGAIIRYPHSKRAFTYSPVNIRKDLRKWVKGKISELADLGYSLAEGRDANLWQVNQKYAEKFMYKIQYWKLVQIVLVPHQRNHNWLDENLEKYEEAWALIEKYKAGYRDDDDKERADLAAAFDSDDDNFGKSDAESLDSPDEGIGALFTGRPVSAPNGKPPGPPKNIKKTQVSKK